LLVQVQPPLAQQVLSLGYFALALMLVLQNGSEQVGTHSYQW
jgi:hypothetical protein